MFEPTNLTINSDNSLYTSRGRLREWKTKKCSTVPECLLHTCSEVNTSSTAVERLLLCYLSPLYRISTTSFAQLLDAIEFLVGDDRQFFHGHTCRSHTNNMSLHGTLKCTPNCFYSFFPTRINSSNYNLRMGTRSTGGIADRKCITFSYKMYYD